MNKIEQIASDLKRELPRAKFKVTAPVLNDGIWFLDIENGGRTITLSWNQMSRFGLSGLAGEFGELDDESFESVERARDRVLQLVANAEESTPPLGVLLARLRESTKTTQSDLAGLLGITQATVSGYERRGDLQLSTLRRVVKALGATMELLVSSPTGRFRVRFEDDALNGAVLPKPTLDQARPFQVKANASTFSELAASGKLARAKKIAESIRSRHTVLKFPKAA